MRASTIALALLLSALAAAGCGRKAEVCHRYEATCTASCLDGTTPRFTAATEACWFESISPEGTDPQAWFCDGTSGTSAAALACPSQQTSGGASDCTACGAWTLGAECACPTFGDGYF